MSTQTVLLIILAAIVASGLALGQYFFRKRSPKWGVFSALRFLVYFALLLLLINPKFKQNSYTLEKPKLVLAIDNSRSIKAFGQSDAVRDFVDELQSNPEIKDRFDVESYTFGNDFKTADSLNFDEGQTDISRAFSNLRKLYARQTAPTVLIT